MASAVPLDSDTKSTAPMPATSTPVNTSSSNRRLTNGSLGPKSVASNMMDAEPAADRQKRYASSGRERGSQPSTPTQRYRRPTGHSDVPAYSEEGQSNQNNHHGRPSGESTLSGSTPRRDHLQGTAMTDTGSEHSKSADNYNEDMPGAALLQLRHRSDARNNDEYDPADGNNEQESIGRSSRPYLNERLSGRDAQNDNGYYDMHRDQRNAGRSWNGFNSRNNGDGRQDMEDPDQSRNSSDSRDGDSPSPSGADAVVNFHGRDVYVDDLVGLRVAKSFEPHGNFLGQVVKYDAPSARFTIVYADGDIEELNVQDTIQVIVQDNVERAVPTRSLRPSNPPTATEAPISEPARTPVPATSDNDVGQHFAISLLENNALPVLIHSGWRVQRDPNTSERTFIPPHGGSRTYSSPLAVLEYIAGDREMMHACFPPNMHQAIQSMFSAPEDSKKRPQTYHETPQAKRPRTTARPRGPTSHARDRPNPNERLERERARASMLNISNMTSPHSTRSVPASASRDRYAAPMPSAYRQHPSVPPQSFAEIPRGARYSERPVDAPGYFDPEREGGRGERSFLRPNGRESLSSGPAAYRYRTPEYSSAGYRGRQPRPPAGDSALFSRRDMPPSYRGESPAHRYERPPRGPTTPTLMPSMSGGSFSMRDVDRNSVSYENGNYPRGEDRGAEWGVRRSAPVPTGYPSRGRPEGGATPMSYGQQYPRMTPVSESRRSDGPLRGRASVDGEGPTDRGDRSG